MTTDMLCGIGSLFSSPHFIIPPEQDSGSALTIRVGTRRTPANSLEQGTLNTFLEGVKLQFLEYPYSLLEETLEWNGLKLSSIVDIACTKLITISARGSKKDFIDLYKILESYTLSNLFKKLDEKYEGVNYNHTHILKSLVYFNDADGQPMPRMHMEVEWDEVKRLITEKVKRFTF